jgi:general stress protein YciG
MSDELKKAAAAMGKKGGSVTGGRKAEASRENGKKGGRPPADIDERLQRDVLRAEARGEARVKQIRTPDGRTLEEITASILVPASIDRARAGKETGWTIGDWSVYRDTDGGVWSAR